MYRNIGSGHHTTMQTHYQHLSLLSVKPLWIFKIQRKFNRLFVIFDLSHVFSLLAVKNDRSGVQDVAWFTKSSLISFTMLGIRFFLHSEFPFMFLYISRKHLISQFFNMAFKTTPSTINASVSKSLLYTFPKKVINSSSMLQLLTDCNRKDSNFKNASKLGCSNLVLIEDVITSNESK